MYKTFIICLLFYKSLAQSGEDIWWLNSNQYRELPPQYKFEDLSEFETDQSAKIVFREDDLLPREEKLAGLKVDKEKTLNKVDKSNPAIKFEDKSEISRLDYTKEAITETTTPTQTQSNNGNKLTNSDIFELKFPDNNFITSNKNFNKINKIKPVMDKNNNTNDFNNTGKITYLTNVVPLKVNTNRASESENICTYMKKPECNRIGGVVYVKHKSNWKHEPFETRLICCILPMRPELQSSTIYFLDTPRPCKRCKRSEKDGTNNAMKQRNALLFRKFGSQAHILKLTTPSPTKHSHRVVTPSDEYLDPYWNIKNIRKPSKQGSQFKQTTKLEYDEDYIEDYIFEIPKPGLTGLYSDNGPSKPGWTFPTIRPTYGVFDSDEVNDEPVSGYSPTVDPRLISQDRRGTIPRVNGRPVKLSTYADIRNYDAESQTITYQSNPDFQVLQGFKLLNLVQNKSRIQRNSKKTTTEKIFDSDSKEHVLTASLENIYDDTSSISDTTQVYKDCGKIVKGLHRNFDDKEIGETEMGSHPSLALVVLTKRRQSFLCYGTIVHPRAVVTVADCVFGRDPGDISVIAGAWRLNEESNEEWQMRMATVNVNSLYRPGDLENNLALLHWKRPLRLTASVQPACLSDPHVGDNCRFFGWGGYDQAIRKQSRWQRAIVIAPRTCEERVTSKRLPTDAFCASLQSRGSVTGIGGPLICSVAGRQSAVGVAVWRDLAVVLLPAHEWVTNTLDDLQLEV